MEEDLPVKSRVLGEHAPRTPFAKDHRKAIALQDQDLQA